MKLSNVRQRRCLSLLACIFAAAIIFLPVPLRSAADSCAEPLVSGKTGNTSMLYCALAMLLIIMDTWSIQRSPAVTAVLFSISTAAFLLAASGDWLGLYYMAVALARSCGMSRLVKVYGPLHILYPVYLLSYFALMGWIIRDAARRNTRYADGELPPDMAKLFDAFARRVGTLSPAERRILNYYIDGYEIADVPELAFISIHTVKKHNRSIYQKLDVVSRDDLMLYIEMFRCCGRLEELTGAGVGGFSTDGGGLAVGIGSSSSKGNASSSQTNTHSEASNAAQTFQHGIKMASEKISQAKRLSISMATSDQQDSVATRIIANHNHSHTMTIQYWEVMRRYRLATCVDSVDLVLFVPLTPIAFYGERQTAVSTSTRPAVTVPRNAQQSSSVCGKFREKYETVMAHYKVLVRTLPVQYRAGLEVIRTCSLMEAWISPNITIPPQKLRSLGPVSIRITDVKLGTTALRHSISTADVSAGAKLSLYAPTDILTRADQLKADQTYRHILANTMRYSQAVWASLTIDERAMLDQYTIHMGWEDDGAAQTDIPLLNCINVHKLLGFYGNCMLFPFTYPKNLAKQIGRTAAELQDTLYRYHSNNFRVPVTTISLPTDGMIGEAVLGATNVSEEIDLTRFWNWKDSPIDSSYLNGTDYLKDKKTRDLTGVTQPANMGIYDALKELLGRENPEFENLTGIDHLKELVSGSTEAAASGRDKAMDTAQESMKSVLDFTHNMKKADNERIKTLLENGYTPDGEYNKEAAQAKGKGQNAAGAKPAAGSSGGRGAGTSGADRNSGSVNITIYNGSAGGSRVESTSNNNKPPKAPEEPKDPTDENRPPVCEPHENQDT